MESADHRASWKWSDPANTHQEAAEVLCGWVVLSRALWGKMQQASHTTRSNRDHFTLLNTGECMAYNNKDCNEFPFDSTIVEDST